MTHMPHLWQGHRPAAVAAAGQGLAQADQRHGAVQGVGGQGGRGGDDVDANLGAGWGGGEGLRG